MQKLDMLANISGFWKLDVSFKHITKSLTNLMVLLLKHPFFFFG